MHWSLDQVRELEEGEFTELCAWLRDRADKSANPDSMDMDAIVDAKKAKGAGTDGTN